jgi:hypothetical protein
MGDARINITRTITATRDDSILPTTSSVPVNAGTGGGAAYLFEETNDHPTLGAFGSATRFGANCDGWPALTYQRLLVYLFLPQRIESPWTSQYSPFPSRTAPAGFCSYFTFNYSEKFVVVTGTNPTTKSCVEHSRGVRTNLSEPYAQVFLPTGTTTYWDLGYDPWVMPGNKSTCCFQNSQTLATVTASSPSFTSYGTGAFNVIGCVP